MKDDPLVTTLLDLLAQVDWPGFRLILGGGYGLYLMQLERQRPGELRTLLAGEAWPRPRTTEDLDVLLPTETVASLDAMRRFRAALDRLGFDPVPDVKFMHFIKPWRGGGRVKIDLLTGPIGEDLAQHGMKVKPPRVRPLGEVELHAHLTTEAIDFDREPYLLSVNGTRSDGTAATGTLYVPQAFTFLLMKLHAFADRVNDADRDRGRHHAMDVYRIVAMLTAAEYDVVRAKVQEHRDRQAVVRAREIVAADFCSLTSVGTLRLREHALFTDAMDAGAMIAALADLFRLTG